MLIRDQDLDQLRPFRDLTLDRGKKNPAKELSKIYLASEKDKIQFVDGDYKSSGKVLSGVKSYLSSEKAKQTDVFIVGVRPGIFDDLHKQADKSSKGTAADTGRQSGRRIASRKNSAQRARVKDCGQGGPKAGDSSGPEFDKEFLGSSGDCERVREHIGAAAKGDSPLIIGRRRRKAPANPRITKE